MKELRIIPTWNNKEKWVPGDSDSFAVVDEKKAPLKEGRTSKWKKVRGRCCDSCPWAWGPQGLLPCCFLLQVSRLLSLRPWAHQRQRPEPVVEGILVRRMEEVTCLPECPPSPPPPPVVTAFGRPPLRLEDLLCRQISV